MNTKRNAGKKRRRFNQSELETVQVFLANQFRRVIEGLWSAKAMQDALGESKQTAGQINYFKSCRSFLRTLADAATKQFLDMTEQEANAIITKG